MAIYMMRETQPITTAWIYHNANLWLISISWDGIEWLTIADKNLWATTAWNYWDEIAASNMWNAYQRWNNYWFPYLSTITTSSTRVNASTYWPWNYYSSSTFVAISWSWASKFWESSGNKNLRWWVTWTDEAMQWPCDSGWHIPSYTELNDLIAKWFAAWAWKRYWSWTNAYKYLKMPIWKGISYNWSRTNFSWPSISHWSSTYDTSTMYLSASEDSITASWGIYNFWFPIRPFKNEAVQPDDSRTVLYQ